MGSEYKAYDIIVSQLHFNPLIKFSSCRLLKKSIIVREQYIICLCSAFIRFLELLLSIFKERNMAN